MGDIDAGKFAHSVKDTHGRAYQTVPMWAPPPRRRPLALVPGGRRPVVAIVDTGVAEHQWLTSSDDEDKVTVDAPGWAGPETVGPGENWHGTFVAGVVRQHAPDAQLMPVTLARGDDGRIVHGQLLQALTWLNQTAFVGVVCVAIGFRLSEQEDPQYPEQVATEIRALGARGSLVVAAAGNDPTVAWNAFFPSLVGQPTPDGSSPLVVVGAVDAGGNWASFSPEHQWVTHREVGVDVVSIVPAEQPPASEQAFTLADDLGYVLPKADPPSGFGTASGTSFAAAAYAGKVAQALLDHAAVPAADTPSEDVVAWTERAMAEVGGRA